MLDYDLWRQRAHQASISLMAAELELKEAIARAETAKASRILPEWRPLSVLTVEAITKWNTWAISKPGEKCPLITDLAPFRQWWMDAVSEATEYKCRPVDREGVPAWSEVGL